MIRTRRLTLRPPRADDLEALHAVFSDPRAMRYWSQPAHDDIAQTRETLDNMIGSHADTGLEYVVERAGAVIGKAGPWRANGATAGSGGSTGRPTAQRSPARAAEPARETQGFLSLTCPFLFGKNR